MKIKPICGHWAIFCAKTYADKGYDVRIAVGPGCKLPHAQACAKINGEWEWLRYSWGKVRTTHKDNFTPKTYEYLDNFWIFWHNKDRHGTPL